MFSFKLLFALAAISSTLAHPVHPERREWRVIGRDSSAVVKVERREEAAANATAVGMDVLAAGNQQFRDEMAANDPALLKTLTDEGQAPPFMFLGCSDSRVSEGTIFKAKPGTLFTQRNIANQFHSTDPNSHSVLSYAVAELGVQHVIVMGHYGCGGVAASIASRPQGVDAANGAVQNWIEPIRQLFQTSTRSEIVELRNKIAGQAVVEEPEVSDPGFRALVEENVKAGVRNIAADTVISNHFAALATSNTESKNVTKRAEGGPISDVFIHGFVYDIETGVIQDLGVSVGPPGKAIPTIPFSTIVKAAEATEANEAKANEAKANEAKANEAKATEANASTASQTKEDTGAKIIAINEKGKRCIENCKAKRSLFSW